MVNGALGTMAVTMLTYPKNLEGSITILGQYGSVKIGGRAVNNIEYWHFADNDSDDNLVEKVNYDNPSVYGSGHDDYYANMIASINGEEEPICNGEEGLKSLEIITAAYKSSFQNNLIKLPLTDKID